MLIQKPDPKIRFQNRNFRSRLQDARNYKRTPLILPDKQWQVVLAKIGLRSWWAKSLAILAVLATVYIIYIPNFLYIKQINITGFKPNEQESIKQTVLDYLDAKKLWPQKNLILLSKNALVSHLLENRKDILKVALVKKHLPGTLSIELEPRVNKYLLETNGNLFLVSNDGIMIAQVASSTTEENLTLVKLSQTDLPRIGEGVFDSNLQQTITTLNRELTGIINLPITYYSLDKNDSPDLNAHTASGLKLVFDVKLNIEDSLKRLRLLWSNIGEADKDRLYYIDMRFDKKGYVCLKNTPCVKDAVIPTQTSTTTPTSTPIQ